MPSRCTRRLKARRADSTPRSSTVISRERRAAGVARDSRPGSPGRLYSDILPPVASRLPGARWRSLQQEGRGTSVLAASAISRDSPVRIDSRREDRSFLVCCQLKRQTPDEVSTEGYPAHVRLTKARFSGAL